MYKLNIKLYIVHGEFFFYAEQAEKNFSLYFYYTFIKKNVY